MKSSRTFLPRRAVAIAAALSVSFATGCYVYEPVTSSMVAPGKSIAVDLNDQGRVALSSLIGPEVRRISGVLVAQSGNDYVVRISELGFFNGKTSLWSGEAVTVRNDYVSGLYEEKLSTSRTALAIGAGALGVGALLAARNLIVNGNNSSTDTKNPPPPPNTNRGNQ